mgnify:CR=1 FL=1
MAIASKNKQFFYSFIGISGFKLSKAKCFLSALDSKRH